MRPLLLNKSKRRSLYILSLVLVVTSALIGAARAGDIASRKIWGFSPDGQFFAFEEYGVQDGSGFPYSNIFISNTRKNSWVKGSPIRVLVQDEAATPDEARQKAMTRAQPIFEQLKISRDGQLLAHNPATEMGRNPHEVTVAPGPVPFLQKHALTFKINDVPIDTRRCDDYGKEAQIGYSLSVQRRGEEEQMLHTDGRIPTSRGCPKRYAIGDVIRYLPGRESKEAVLVVILQMFTYGFEGDDGRYLATSHWLPTFNATN